MARIKIEVTQKDIEQGIPSSPWHCPIALAVKRTCGGDDISVGVCVRGIENRAYQLSGRALTFMSKFDKGEAVEPLVIILDDARSYEVEPLVIIVGGIS